MASKLCTPATYRAAGHPKSDPTSNPYKSGTICLIFLKIYVQRVPPSHSSHLKFQVNRTNSFQVIAVGSWVRFLADFWSFESKSTFNVKSRYSDASWRRYRHQIWKRTNVLAWPAFSTVNFVTAGVFWIWPQNSYLHVLSHCALYSHLNGYLTVHVLPHW